MPAGAFSGESRTALAREARRERTLFLGLALPALLIVGLCALLPVLWIVRQSFLSIGGDVTFANYERLFGSSLTLATFETTLLLSAATLALCMLLGLPLALVLAAASPRTANRLLILVMLPLWTSILVRTYGWLVILGRDGLANDVLVGSGLVDAPLALVYNFTGTLVGMVHFMLPLFVLPVYAAFRDIDRNAIRASASLGASFWRTLRSVVLPLASGGIASGSMIVFVYTLGFFITPAILGGGRVTPIAIRIERNLSTFQDWGAASALGVLLLLLVAIVATALSGVRRLLRRQPAGA
ncbi:ABC transporter permease [Aureimonas flava]|uniref:ABC transporter permease n=1 Tax=Aureimonas flava TaxID=2320271 RepID=A0A3A1WRT7_9HYPH|nr:ABC transporter permease [Aureimonas flava]